MSELLLAMVAGGTSGDGISFICIVSRLRQPASATVATVVVVSNLATEDGDYVWEEVTSAGAYPQSRFYAQYCWSLRPGTDVRNHQKPHIRPGG